MGKQQSFPCRFKGCRGTVYYSKGDFMGYCNVNSHHRHRLGK